MRFVLIAFGTISAALASPLIAQESLTMSVPPVVAQDHAALLASDDPRLAANKRLVYDMYRIVLQGGHWDRAHEFIAEDYIQHNPNAAQGLQGLIDYVRASRPVREIQHTLDLPLIHLMRHGTHAQRELVRSCILQGDEQHFDEILAALTNSGALAYTRKQAEDASARATAALAGVADGPFRQSLLQLAAFAVERTH